MGGGSEVADALNEVMQMEREWTFLIAVRLVVRLTDKRRTFRRKRFVSEETPTDWWGFSGVYIYGMVQL
ncbi:MAG: hypothetical protein ACRC3H_13150 [Lachnospiraceae bacterium]